MLKVLRENKVFDVGAHSIWSSAPSARRMSISNKFLLFFFIVLSISGISVYPHASLKTGQFLVAGIISLMASLRIFAAIIACGKMGVDTVFAKTTPNSLTTQIDWPHFTILVPLYKEDRVVKTLMENLTKLEYPREKLAIIMVCEIDDHATCRAVAKHIRPPFKLFEVGPSEPRTKPKALNSALAFTPQTRRDDIVTVYDAEDRPHPYQLKAAALALKADPKLAAVQAPLGYYNAKQNLLTRFFALEYAALFHVWNPALTYLRLPFTLGGTSNHIRRQVIEKAGGWDSHNVTEDADLSFKITALGGRNTHHKIGCIDYGTQEEAVANTKPWTHQRSRWLKGFMQTWAVHMRQKHQNPAGEEFSITSRIKNAIALQITVGTTLLAAFLHVPSLCIATGLIVMDSFHMVDFALQPSFYTLVAYGYGAAILSSMVGAIKEGKLYLIPYAALMPFYWLLQFPAAVIAAREFITAPSYWRKTEHTGTDINNDLEDASSALEPSLGYPI